jgi:hypothetical protein
VSDRADDLRRQRDLLREHLAWIERELAAEEASARTEEPRSPAPPPFQPPPLETRAPVDDRDAEAILAEYRTPAVSIATKTKLGCVAYFAVAVFLIAGLVLAFYLYTRAARGR